MTVSGKATYYLPGHGPSPRRTCNGRFVTSFGITNLSWGRALFACFVILVTAFVAHFNSRPSLSLCINNNLAAAERYRHEAPTILGIGDSYLGAAKLRGDKIFLPGCSVAMIRQAVFDAPAKQYDVVMVMMGIANLKHAPLDETREEVFEASVMAHRKFQADLTIVYDPAEMVRLMSFPEYRQDDTHLNDAGYLELFRSGRIIVISE